MNVTFEKVKIRKASYLVVFMALMASIYLAGTTSAHAYTKYHHEKKKTPVVSNTKTQFKSVKIDNLDIFYREAGNAENQTIVLLHDLSSSSHMYRNLIPHLARNFHVIAPDYPGSGNSTQTENGKYEYSFDTISRSMEKFLDRVGEKKYTLYLAGKGAPIGFRLAAKYPERIEGLIIQDGNAYDEGLQDYWMPIKAYWNNKSSQNAEIVKDTFISNEAIKNQYLRSAGNNASLINPDSWNSDIAFLNHSGNKDIQLELLYDYNSNVYLHSQWQNYFNTHQPATLVVWGKNDTIFPVKTAESYKGDLNKVDIHLLDTGHHVLELKAQKVSKLVANFMKKNHRTKQLSNWNRKFRFNKVISARRF